MGGRNEWTNIDIVQLLCRLVDEAFAARPGLARRFPRCPAAVGRPTASSITFVKDRPGHDRRYAIDARRSSGSWASARGELETGIRKTLAWYLTHEGWWRAVMDGSYRRWTAQHYGISE